MTRALIAFGANIGDVRSSFGQAMKQIDAVDGVTLVASATPVVTTAVTGGQSSGDKTADYLNSAMLVETSLSAEALFEVTQKIEQDHGRQRDQNQRRWGPRRIDLDIILFGRQIVDRPGLQVPHRRMSFRRFVLDPAIEIGAEMMDPVSQVALRTLRDRIDQRAERVLWVTDDLPHAQSVAASLPGGGGGVLEIVTDLKHAMHARDEYRLLLFWEAAATSCSQAAFSANLFKSDSFKSDSFSADFLSTVRQFAGPWLNLTGLIAADPELSAESSRSIQSEIAGALEAMQCD